VRQEALEIAVMSLAPIVPHICHELWQHLGQGDALWNTRWRRPDPAALVQDAIEIVVQVNGKLRGRVSVAPGASDDEVRALALADEGVRRFFEGRDPRNPQFTDHCFTGDYPTRLVDRDGEAHGHQLSFLAEVG
jgi:leucyl-tRNA synthetase